MTACSVVFVRVKPSKNQGGGDIQNVTNIQFSNHNVYCTQLIKERRERGNRPL